MSEKEQLKGGREDLLWMYLREYGPQGRQGLTNGRSMKEPNTVFPQSGGREASSLLSLP